MQKDRLTEELMATLSSFQATQRRAVEKEKEEVQRARANMRSNDPFRGPPGKIGLQMIEEIGFIDTAHSSFVAKLQNTHILRYLALPGKHHEPLIELDNVSSRSSPSQKQTQQMLAQEQLNLQELEDKERDLLQLEVTNSDKH